MRRFWLRDLATCPLHPARDCARAGKTRLRSGMLRSLSWTCWWASSFSLCSGHGVGCTSRPGPGSHCSTSCSTWSWTNRRGRQRRLYRAVNGLQDRANRLQIDRWRQRFRHSSCPSPRTRRSAAPAEPPRATHGRANQGPRAGNGPRAGTTSSGVSYVLPASVAQRPRPGAFVEPGSVPPERRRLSRYPAINSAKGVMSPSRLAVSKALM